MVGSRIVIRSRGSREAGLYTLPQGFQPLPVFYQVRIETKSNHGYPSLSNLSGRQTLVRE